MMSQVTPSGKFIVAGGVLLVFLLQQYRKAEQRKGLKFMTLTSLQNIDPSLVLCVDCSVRGYFAVTHHRVSDNKNKNQDVRGDTSTELVLDLVTSSSITANKRQYVSCNHYDIDALLSLITATNPAYALQNKQLFIRAACIGDFREFDYESFKKHNDEIEDKALRLCCKLNSVEMAQFVRPFDGMEEEKLCFFMKEWPNIFSSLTITEEYLSVLQDCEMLYDRSLTKVSYYVDVGLVIVETPRPVHYYALFSLTKGYDICLTVYPDQRYEVEQKYTSYVELESRKVFPRVCMSHLARILNQRELNKGYRWSHNRFVDSGPLLRLNKVEESISKAERYGSPSQRRMFSSSIPTDEFKDLVVGYFRFAYSTNVSQPQEPKDWSFLRLHGFNASIEWSKFSQLPELLESNIELLTPNNMTVKLVHLKDPKAGVFSQAKKQCDLWEFVWGTSLLFSSLLASFNLERLKVLEIGGGSGLCSLTVALGAASHVTMTDLVEDAVRLCERSACVNKIPSEEISFRKLDWNKPETLPEEACDLVIASDVLFYRGTVKPVARVFNQTLKPGGIGLLADPCRCNTEDFESALDDYGIKTTTYLFRPEMVRRGQDLAQKAFVDVKKVKLLVFRKIGTDSALDECFKGIQSQLDRFVSLEGC